MLAKISTSLLPVEEFQFRLRQVCGLFNAEAIEGQGDIRGQVMVENRVGIEMAHVAKDLQKICRTSADCRRDDGEHFFLVIQEEGSSLMAQSDTARMMHPGDMILIDSAKPSEFTFFGKYGRQLSLHLPRTEMRERFGENIRSGLFLPRSDHTALAMVAVLAKAFSSECPDNQDIYLRETMFGLLGVMLHEREGRGRFTEIETDLSGAQLLKRGLSYIDYHFSDSNLTIQTVADNLHVSIRQLQRAFALVGTTPTDYLAQKRLESACQLLLERRAGKTDVLVSSIAYASGFNDISHFNRQFRRAFGCAPGQYGE